MLGEACQIRYTLKGEAERYNFLACLAKLRKFNYKF